VRAVRESWSRYWSAPGGRHGAAIVRVAIAASVLLTLVRLGSTGMASGAEAAPLALYRPLSWWLIFGAHAPSASVVGALHAIAWVSTSAMLVGLRTRTATIVSLVAALGLAAYASSFSPTWAHEYNVVFLAQLAFVGARAGDVWSVDAWWRARRGRPVAPPGAAYAWSLRLAQLAVALMFLSAFVCKLGAAGGTLRWALSDNLRHQLLSRFDLIGVPRTAAAAWLLAAPWRWQAAALGNLVSQAMPIGAVFAVRRPWLRAAFGAFFVVETLALGVVMDLWNLHWLPLAAVFVDWDALLGARADAPGATAHPPRAARRFVVAFVVYDVFVSFAPKLDQMLRTYPFSSFPMFAKVLAKQPYARHQSYELVGARVEVLADAAIDPALQRWIDQSYEYRTMWRLYPDPPALERRLGALLTEVRTRAGSAVQVRGLRLHMALFQAPAVPAPATLRYIPFLTLAEIDAAGDFRMY
jgi:hypothetical protein